MKTGETNKQDLFTQYCEMVRKNKDDPKMRDTDFFKLTQKVATLERQMSVVLDVLVHFKDGPEYYIEDEMAELHETVKRQAEGNKK